MTREQKAFVAGSLSSPSVIFPPRASSSRAADAMMVSSLVSSVYVRLRSLVFKINSTMQVTNVSDIRRIIIQTSEIGR